MHWDTSSSKKKFHPIIASKQSNSKSIILYFCNFYSYLLIFPFKFEWCSLSGQFVLKCSKLRKVLCSITHTIVVIASTPTYIELYQQLGETWSDVNLLMNISYVICTIAMYEFIHIMWTQQNHLLDAVNWHIKMKIVHRTSLLQIGFCCMFPLLYIGINNPLVIIVNKLIGIPSKNGYDFTKFYNLDRLFISPCYFFMYTSLSYSQLYFLVSTGFTLALTLSIRESIIQMEKDKQVNYASADIALFQGIKNEKNIRRLIDITNSITSRKIFFEYLLILSWYATILDTLDPNSKESFFKRLHLVSYLLYSGALWIIACEIHCLVRNFTKEWATWYRSKFVMQSPETLKYYKTCFLGLQTESAVNAASIECRCFSVTYGFLGSMLGLIFTYSTIVYQMKAETKSVI